MFSCRKEGHTENGDRRSESRRGRGCAAGWRTNERSSLGGRRRDVLTPTSDMSLAAQVVIIDAKALIEAEARSVAEAHALGRQAVKIRGLGPGIAIAAEPIGPGCIQGNYQDVVGVTTSPRG
jgi:hypothetical protein